MAYIHNLGFPRIGKKRELKFAVESYWRGEINQDELLEKGKAIRVENWAIQANAGIELLPVGDFAWYDHILNTSLLLGAIPKRHVNTDGSVDLDTLFRVSRGKSPSGCACAASEMTKWFNTNYHYIVPELSKDQSFGLSWQALFEEVGEAHSLGYKVKPVLVGPITYLHLAKCADESFNKLSLLDKLLPVYQQVLKKLAELGVEWVQVDEPVLALELPEEYRSALNTSLAALNEQGVKILLASYFDSVKDYYEDIQHYPVAGVHFDCVAGEQDLAKLNQLLNDEQVLSLGLINGRNIWRADLSSIYNQIEPIAQSRGDNLWLAPSCSLLHTPVDLEQEDKLDAEIRDWLAFAKQKLQELKLLKLAIENEELTTLDLYSEPVKARASSKRVNNIMVQEKVASLNANHGKRQSAFSERVKKQQASLGLPLLPTTTIGSFPQTQAIRQARKEFKAGIISAAEYENQMQAEIRYAVEEQEALDIDVLVHGEAERNDMVEYFGEQLEGFAFTQFGWVQSYGSRCVKPPIIWGDVSREEPMTVSWTQYAQAQTAKKMKGMLTGPVTILFWSFTRDDLDKPSIANQIALALRDEVVDLQNAGIDIIQIDEPAFREGMPLKASEWQSYLDWAAYAFRVSASGVKDETQIHTHMCYAKFNDIIGAIADMDADVITIETSRSNMELLNAFEDFAYPNEIGPGVYDIHSPNVPDIVWVKSLIHKAAKKIPVERLWVNPDCGLKTRGWEETRAALENMVKATKELREELGAN
ncbi:5-methyltetrahydropteroyltriglutamate--homocysteine S-methyltransferase [Pseudoalteromonas phenolica]|uniref:5-methyltetrahydropteroyltriglutamate--homocysteine methyltransferase n=1 Tax=Pseudoalteromonas phenolica TaxID=161398 RepID=A0A0S2JZY0_9GAMM|nr:5-methyltetrahydropteroyltriglutamate--homocysteine S-methyltransferase [Pseudoalteromonas phenolica]ALO41579.1 5-methyltetrahydropteroyltriglutamate--homocysteine methyltransferase [Pseudoalteromonas phenolica]MBE0353873.1 5-methyltetrahydropteroyltriglutamate--homocysteine methyltransferase [Pseudoalteromonas phenolica O-BC30]RXE96462.1 5-methyltetrahydropteroyltriglutamate--homocysteine S-methyltransferase [Pseudoalteromonas phenolica O-BC30]